LKYLGEYVIPIAAVIVAFAVVYWVVLGIGGVLIKRLVKRMLA
jgi:hypothetical protein